MRLGGLTLTCAGSWGVAGSLSNVSRGVDAPICMAGSIGDSGYFAYPPGGNVSWRYPGESDLGYGSAPSGRM